MFQVALAGGPRCRDLALQQRRLIEQIERLGFHLFAGTDAGGDEFRGQFLMFLEDGFECIGLFIGGLPGGPSFLFLLGLRDRGPRRKMIAGALPCL